MQKHCVYWCSGFKNIKKKRLPEMKEWIESREIHEFRFENITSEAVELAIRKAGN